jgi:flavodoxin
MYKMNCLVVYYSRTGLTRKVGEAVSDLLQCDREELFEQNKRSGLSGYVSMGMEGLLKKRVEIKEPAKDPANYDLVVIGTPVWCMNLSSPVRSYLFRHRGRFKAVAFFASQGAIGSGNAFKEMEKVCGKKPVSIMEIDKRDRFDGECISKVKEYADEIKR